jgi:hypothetical protein
MEENNEKQAFECKCTPEDCRDIKKNDERQS